MFSLSAGPGAYQVWANRLEGEGAYWMMVGVPGTAAAAFLFLSLMFPQLYGSAGIKFPRQISLPLVFTSLLPTCAALWLTTPQELQKNFDVIQFAKVWEQPGELMIALGAQILGITLVGLLRRVQ
jgi:hypothetical protein